jgi:hypothetical protein
MFYIIFMLVFLLVPSFAFAWGPLTHIYLANEIFSYVPLIPVGILGLIKRYRQDFLYGNLMADMIIGKKYLPDDRCSHSWEVGMKLLGQADKGSEKAFAYGFLSHLAADTVAHGTLTDDTLNLEHAWLEMKADSMINKMCWLQSVTISRRVQRRNDRLMEGSLDRYVFSFKTNKRIFKGMVFLSLLNKKRKRFSDRAYIGGLHDESIARMLDVLQNGKDAEVMNISPL